MDRDAEMERGERSERLAREARKREEEAFSSAAYQATFPSDSLTIGDFRTISTDATPLFEIQESIEAGQRAAEALKNMIFNERALFEMARQGKDWWWGQDKIEYISHLDDNYRRLGISSSRKETEALVGKIEAEAEKFPIAKTTTTLGATKKITREISKP